MDISLTSDQLSVQNSARRMIGDYFPLEAPTMDPRGAAADRLWEQIGKAGWLEVGLPARYGGSDGSFLDLGIIVRELGRAAAPPTFRAALTGRLLIERLADETHREALLPGIANGTRLIVAALTEPEVHVDLTRTRTQAREMDRGWRLTGRKSLVLEADRADSFLIPARTGADSVDLFVVDRDTPGLTLTERPVISGDPHCDLELRDAEVGAQGRLGALSGTVGANAVRLVRDDLNALIAAEAVGGTESILELVADYTTKRKQFGVPIGSFQAVQHLLADIAIGLSGARMLTWKALSLREHAGEHDWSSAAAKAAACRTFTEATIVCHQVFGGIGITTEWPLYRFSGRAKVLEQLSGAWHQQLQTVAGEIGLRAV